MSRLLKNKKILITQKYKTSIHEAIDLVGENYSLDYIISHSAGVVEKVRKDYKTNDISGNSYGNFVKIQHDNGYYTLYAHLKYGSVDVNVGDRVKKVVLFGTWVIQDMPMGHIFILKSETKMI